MSKTGQRKRGMYREGWNDAKAGRYFKWERHPYIDSYRKGYHDFRKTLPEHSKPSLWGRAVKTFKRAIARLRARYPRYLGNPCDECTCKRFCKFGLKHY